MDQASASHTSPARYADGRAAITHNAEVRFGAEAFLLRVGGGSTAWRYDRVQRVDDDNGHLIFKQIPDTGERLILDAATLGPSLRAAAPQLFTNKARGRESWRLVGGLVAAGAALAMLFLVGVPFAAKPIARIVPAGYNDRLGQIGWAQVDGMGQRCNDVGDEAGQAALTALGQRLTLITRPETRERLNITVIAGAPGSLLEQPNAFALADGSVIVTKAMIDMMQSPDELAGVLAHEIGHIDERHVMANVIRQIGAGVFFDVVFGGAGAGQAIAVASVNMASLGYTRSDEAEADARGFDFMDAAGFNPGASSALFDRYAAMERDAGGGEAIAFLKSHPASAERAAAARARAHASSAVSLSPGQWRAVQSMCGGAAPAPLFSNLPLPGAGRTTKTPMPGGPK